MNTVFFQLLNLTPFWLINYACAILTIYSCIPKNKNFKWVAICIGLKMLLKNVLFDVVFMSLYGNNNWAQHLNVWYSIFSTLFIFVLYKISFKLPWEKVSVIAIISDSRALCCSFIPITIFAYLFHYDIMNHLQDSLTIYNFFIIPVTLFMVFLTQYIGKDLWKYVREKDMKHPRFWNVVLIISICWGISNSCRLDDFLYPYQMFTIAFAVTFLTLNYS